MARERPAPSKRVGRPKAGASWLTREKILATALRLVDEHGLDALSMRRLARELGADPMSLYHHVPSKAAIVSGLVDTVFAEMRLPDVHGGRWEDQVRTWVAAYRDLARAHPHLVLQIVTDAAAVAHAATLISEPLYTALETAGLPPSTIAHASGMFVDYVHGFALGDAGAGSGSDHGRGQIDERLAAEGPEHLPVMRRVHAVMPPRAQDSDSGFAVGIEIMIGGLRGMVATDEE